MWPATRCCRRRRSAIALLVGVDRAPLPAPRHARLDALVRRARAARAVAVGGTGLSQAAPVAATAASVAGLVAALEPGRRRPGLVERRAFVGLVGVAVVAALALLEAVAADRGPDALVDASVVPSVVVVVDASVVDAGLVVPSVVVVVEASVVDVSVVPSVVVVVVDASVVDAGSVVPSVWCAVGRRHRLGGAVGRGARRQGFRRRRCFGRCPVGRRPVGRRSSRGWIRRRGSDRRRLLGRHRRRRGRRLVHGRRRIGRGHHVLRRSGIRAAGRHRQQTERALQPHCPLHAESLANVRISAAERTTGPPGRTSERDRAKRLIGPSSSRGEHEVLFAGGPRPDPRYDPEYRRWPRGRCR